MARDVVATKKKVAKKKAAPKKQKAAATAKQAAPSAPKTDREILDARGIEAVCELLSAGKMQREAAKELGVDPTILSRWLSDDPQRSARAREARAAGAAVWDEMAMEELMLIPDDAQQGRIARAREVASHYRWRASKLGRAEYGEKVDINHGGKVELTDEQLDKRLAYLLGKAGVGGAVGGKGK